MDGFFIGDQATQQHSAVSEELAATAEQFAAQANHFQETIAFFKTEGIMSHQFPVQSPPVQDHPHQEEKIPPVIETKETAGIEDDILDAEFERF